MGRRAEILELLASEDVNSDEMDFGVAMLARLGGGHVDDLARTTLDDDEAVLSQGRALHRIGGGSASIGGLELVVMLKGRSAKAKTTAKILHRVGRIRNLK